MAARGEAPDGGAQATDETDAFAVATMGALAPAEAEAAMPAAASADFDVELDEPVSYDEFRDPHRYFYPDMLYYADGAGGARRRAVPRDTVLELFATEEFALSDG